MLKRWMLYLAVWVGCLIFYYAYGQWLGWVLLAAVSVLPVCSLVLSLPVMLTARLQLRMPAAVSAGDLTALELTLRSVLPHPDWKVRVLAHHPLSGKTWLLQLRCHIGMAQVFQTRQHRQQQHQKTPAELQTQAHGQAANGAQPCQHRHGDRQAEGGNDTACAAEAGSEGKQAVCKQMQEVTTFHLRHLRCNIAAAPGPCGRAPP